MYCQFFLTIFYLEKLKTRIEYKKYLAISLIPFGIGYLLEYLNVGIIGAAILFITSFIFYLRIGLISKDDINDMCKIIDKSNEESKITKKIVAILEKCYLL